MSHYSPPYAGNQPIKVIPVNEIEYYEYDGQSYKILAYLQHNGINKPIIKVDGYLSVVGKKGDLYKLHIKDGEEIDGFIMIRVQKNDIPLKYSERDHQYYLGYIDLWNLLNINYK